MFLRKIFYISLFLILLLSTLVFGFYKALPLILGPEIKLSTPENGLIADGTAIPVRGTVLRSKTLFVNGIPTAFTENGIFETRLAIYPGNNILIIEAYDKFDRKEKLVLNIGTK